MELVDIRDLKSLAIIAYGFKSHSAHHLSGVKIMSADNGIYILETRGPEFRIGHCMSIDDITYQPNYGPFNKEMLLHKFENRPIKINENDAWDIAHEIYKKIIKECGFPPEYGIQKLSFLDIDFPKE